MDDFTTLLSDNFLDQFSEELIVDEIYKSIDSLDDFRKIVKICNLLDVPYPIHVYAFYCENREKLNDFYCDPKLCFVLSIYFSDKYELLYNSKEWIEKLIPLIYNLKINFTIVSDVIIVNVIGSGISFNLYIDFYELLDTYIWLKYLIENYFKLLSNKNKLKTMIFEGKIKDVIDIITAEYEMYDPTLGAVYIVLKEALNFLRQYVYISDELILRNISPIIYNLEKLLD